MVCGGADSTDFDLANRRAEAFRKFAGTRPSERFGARDLGRNLSNLMARFGTGDEEFDQGFLSQFDSPDAESPWERIQNAFSAAIMPRLQATSPYLRNNLKTILTEQFRNQFAQDPTKFRRPMDVFEEFQRRGFIPQSIVQPTTAGGF